MIPLLVLGFLVGMRHALEADHIAAVSSLATRSASTSECLRQGLFWGLGHTVTLVVFGSLVLVLDRSLSPSFASGLEMAVGAMLVLLGLDLLRRLLSERIHFHVHQHENGIRHFHGHSHAGERAHGSHGHEHRRKLPLRALLVGLMHGMAGSAALVLLAVETAPGVVSGLLYILLFGCGSIAGMALLSLVIAVPLRYSPAGLTRLAFVLQAVIGLATVGIGVSIAVEASRAFFRWH
jgi:ABC-type nickel/cobalt efflux system permease component RcnA